MDRTLRATAGWAFPVQVAWAVLSAIWNIAGVMLPARGRPAPGPTATVAGGVILLAIAAAFVALGARWPLGYVVLSVATGLVALAAVVNAFVQDPALWPSEFWRYAGAILNGAGFVAAVAALLAYFRWKK
jgi:hypothetical protein